MSVGVFAKQKDALDGIWNAFCAAPSKREEDRLSVMWCAYLDGKSKAKSGEKSSAGVGEHISIQHRV
jgi:hypothetical protein